MLKKEFRKNVFKLAVLPMIVVILLWVVFIFTSITFVQKVEKELNSKNSSITKETGKFVGNVFKDFKEGLEETK